MKKTGGKGRPQKTLYYARVAIKGYGRPYTEKVKKSLNQESPKEKKTRRKGGKKM